MDNQPKPGEIVILASGAVIFIFSFFKWFDETGFSPSAWGEGLFPLLTLPAIFGLIMAAHIALTRFANVDFPDEIASFTWNQIHLVLAVYSVLILLAYLIVDKGFGFGDAPGLAFGFWLSLVGSLGLVAGAVMLTVDEGATGGTGGGAAPPPQQF